MERLSYLVNNPRITAETFYDPLIKQFLQGWEGSELILTLDTSQLGEEFCLVEVCMAWGGRSFPLAQKVMEHRSAMISDQDYREVLERVSSLLPNNCQITLLADRGFEQGELIRFPLKIFQFLYRSAFPCARGFPARGRSSFLSYCLGILTWVLLL